MTFREEDRELRHQPQPSGGMRVGMVDPTIIIVHKPTGLSVMCRDHNTQWKNKQQAMKELGDLVASRSLSSETDK